MKFRKFISLAVVSAVSLSLLSGCKGTPMYDESKMTEQTSSQAAGAGASAEKSDILNFNMPEIGEKIAVITVKDYGEIKIKLFPEQTPKAVENFIGLSEMGYYDELIFHRVVKNFVDQTGDPQGSGFGGKSMWGENFTGEVGEGLYHFSGAVAYAHTSQSFTNGSQFYIVNTPDGYLRNTCEQLNSQAPEKYSWSQDVVNMYHSVGGTPSLDGDYTVFGQVFEGMDIVRAIGEAETDENDKPLTQVIMESVRIEEYKG